jgi:hypothetical protein
MSDIDAAATLAACTLISIAGLSDDVNSLSDVYAKARVALDRAFQDALMMAGEGSAHERGST